jgi:hypothetical protein
MFRSPVSNAPELLALSLPSLHLIRVLGPDVEGLATNHERSGCAFCRARQPQDALESLLIGFFCSTIDWSVLVHPRADEARRENEHNPPEETAPAQLRALGESIKNRGLGSDHDREGRTLNHRGLARDPSHSNRTTVVGLQVDVEIRNPISIPAAHHLKE